MSLNLDPRRRAMLEEMGITLWLPQPVAPATAPAAPPPQSHAAPAAQMATQTAAQAAAPSAAAVPAPQTATPAKPAPTPTAQAAPQSTPAPTPAAPAPAPTEAETALWRMAPWVQLYPQASGPATGGPWLILLESTNPITPFAGDVGGLLDKMLRALALHEHPQVWLAVLQRQGSKALPIAGSLAPVDWQPLEQQLPQALAQLQPQRLLLFGQKVAHTLLQRSDPIGQLRQQAHSVQGIPTAVTYDPSFLLRTAQPRRYKGETWADLQFAQGLGQIT